MRILTVTGSRIECEAKASRFLLVIVKFETHRLSIHMLLVNTRKSVVGTTKALANSLCYIRATFREIHVTPEKIRATPQHTSRQQPYLLRYHRFGLYKKPNKNKVLEHCEVSLRAAAEEKVRAAKGLTMHTTHTTSSSLSLNLVKIDTSDFRAFQ